MPLNAIKLSIDSRNVLTKQGVQINAKGAAQIKIESKDPATLKRACTNFLGKSEAEIQQIALLTMEGHQRSIMGKMTVEEVYQVQVQISDFRAASKTYLNQKKRTRKALQKTFLKLPRRIWWIWASAWSRTFWPISTTTTVRFIKYLPVISLILGYLKAIGAGRAAEVQRDARIAQVVGNDSNLV